MTYSGGLLRTPTTGYFLATLQVAGSVNNTNAPLMGFLKLSILFIPWRKRLGYRKVMQNWGTTRATKL
jgi:hypothetical protein